MDYKIAEQREINGEVVYQRVRYYLGAVTTEDELNADTQQLEPVTRYRRSKMVEEVEYVYG